MRLALMTVVAVLALIAAQGTAQADPIADVAKVGRLVAKSDDLAHVYWAHRGHPFAGGVRYRTRSMARGVYGAADRQRRIVYISSALIGAVLSNNAGLSRWGIGQTCDVIVHETGHLAVGYGHRTGYPAIDDPLYNVPACVRLSRRGV